MKNQRTIFLGIFMGVFIAAVLLLVFFVGIQIGRSKNRLFPFLENRSHESSGFLHKRYGHGVIGVIDTIGNNTLVVKDYLGELKTILIDEQTLIKIDKSVIKFSNLKKDEKVIILGEPQEKEGTIKAKVIRVIADSDKNSTKSSNIDLK